MGRDAQSKYFLDMKGSWALLGANHHSFTRENPPVIDRLVASISTAERKIRQDAANPSRSADALEYFPNLRPDVPRIRRNHRRIPA